MLLGVPQPLKIDQASSLEAPSLADIADNGAFTGRMGYAHDAFRLRLTPRQPLQA
jgi:hypothetical protein